MSEIKTRISVMEHFSFEWSNWDSILVFIVIQSIAFIAASHAIIYKKNPKSSIAWTGLILLSPGIGALLYWWLGINRSGKKAKKLFQKRKIVSSYFDQKSDRKSLISNFQKNIYSLEKFSSKITGSPLYTKNMPPTPLLNGDESYPEMIASIRSAESYIFLCSYIFDNDRTGKQVAKALREASERGVKVRVLVDDIGARYSFPSIFRELKGKNIKAVRFQRSFWPWRFHYAQLRNHRKLLIVDRKVAFIGGINIRDRHIIRETPIKKAVQDIHFKIAGDVIRELQQVFLKDWSVATGEKPDALCTLSEIGPNDNTDLTTPLRVVSDGPDEDFDKLRWVILGAITSAEKSISIVNPYFLPDSTIISALGIASTKGVKVRIILPEENNHKLVKWACFAMLGQVLERGCRVYLSPRPFDHSKIFVVDEVWSLIGSTNWDARSLRLNFELNMECYSSSLAKPLETLVSEKIKSCRALSLNDLQNRNFFIKLRDGIARLFTPYL